MTKETHAEMMARKEAKLAALIKANDDKVRQTEDALKSLEKAIEEQEREADKSD